MSKPTLVDEKDIPHASVPFALEIRGHTFADWTIVMLAPTKNHAELRASRERLTSAGYQCRVRRKAG